MKKYLKKKRVLFPAIIAIQIVAIQVITNTFGFETHNSLYAAITSFVMMGTLLSFSIIIVKRHRKQASTMDIPLFGNLLSICYIFIVSLSIMIPSLLFLH